MQLFSWLDKRRTSQPQTRRSSASLTPRFRPQLEALEDRWMPSILTVTNNLDGMAGSLRAEIAAAQSGDTINFAPSLDGQTITLNAGDLVINKNLTIQGPGAGLLAISPNLDQCGTDSRVFEVDGAKTNVTLSGLSIINGDGSAASMNGGNCGWSGGSGKSAVAPEGEGGGIWNGGTLTLFGCTLSGNYALGEGGGIYNAGTLTVIGCTVSGNSSGDFGGGIYNDKHGKLTIQSSVVINNGAGFGGADIYNLGHMNISSDSTVGVIGS